MKKIAIIFTLVLTTTWARAQQTTANKISIGAISDFAIPFDDEYGYIFGGGISARFEFPVITNVKFIFSPGYFVSSSTDRNFYYFEDVAQLIVHGPRPHTTYKFIPVRVGLKYFLSDNVYFEGDAGKIVHASKLTSDSYYFSGGIGGTAPVDDHNAFEFSANFEKGYKNNDFYSGVSSHFAMRVGYLYSF